MKTFKVTFINRRRCTLWREFLIAAASANDARIRAERRLTDAGERVQWYQRPKVEVRV